MAFIKRVNTRALTLIALESGLILGAVAIAAGVRVGDEEAFRFFAAPDKFLKGCLIAAVCQFCLYINDLYDLPNDRKHPTKRHRPLASGLLPLGVALCLAPALLAAAAAVSFFLGAAPALGARLEGGVVRARSMRRNSRPGSNARTDQGALRRNT